MIHRVCGGLAMDSVTSLQQGTLQGIRGRKKLKWKFKMPNTPSHFIFELVVHLILQAWGYYT